MTLDIVFSLLLGYGAYRGFARGIIISVLSLLGYLIATLVVLHFTGYFIKLFNLSGPWASTTAYFVLFLSIIIVFQIVAKLLEKMLEAMSLNFINKISGALVGMMVVTLLLSITVWFLHNLRIVSDETISSSKCGGFLVLVAPTIFEWLSYVFPIVKDTIDSLDAFFKTRAQVVN